jgi:hypothetical protein
VPIHRTIPARTHITGTNHRLDRTLEDDAIVKPYPESGQFDLQPSKHRQIANRATAKSP